MQTGSTFINSKSKQYNGYIIIDDESKLIFFILLISQFFLDNGSYLFLSLITLFALFYLLQNPYKSGVFTFVAIHHVAQIIAGVYEATYLGKDLDFRSSQTSVATIVSLIGLFFLFAPIIYFQNKLPVLNFGDLKRYASKLSASKTLTCYLIFFFISSSLSTTAFVYSSFTQIILSFIKIKWLFFLLFGMLSIIKKEKRIIFYSIILLEFITGFYSYFSAFKNVIYFVIILLLMFLKTINTKGLIVSIIILCFLGFFALFWTSIKGQYRSFLNSGEKTQHVLVSQDDALNKLYSLSNNVNQDQLNSAVFNFLDRLQYTYHFSKTIERVPSRLPFTNGKNWLDNLEFSTTPRFLNPDKPFLEPTEKTKKYTGINYAGFKKGVSFSLGYFAECYIDFGFIGMMVLLFTIGLIYGIIYWYLMRNSSTNLVFNYAVVGSFFTEFYAFEMDGTHLLGRLFSSFVTFYILIKLVFPWLIRYISVPIKPNTITQ